MLAAFAFFAAPGTAAAADPVIAAAGDIACASFATPTACKQQATSDQLVGTGYAKVLSLGDQQYENGSLSLFNTYYDPSWGRVKSITAPVPGNHEYLTSGASGYFDYFGSLAGERGKGYYSFNLGSWHLVGLNSNCSKVSCSAGSLQEQWLR
ncbi:MAG TPA: alkaline phosphatase, partial [Thermoanaerobaculia bacterium]|nr:alkaline phosphatase [Thermoanaerobaculia bacterium]